MQRTQIARQASPDSLAASCDPSAPDASGAMMIMRALAAGLLACAALWSHAEIPASYSPVVLHAQPDTAEERVFDLTAAFERARRSGKPVLIYLGAAECPPCRQYTQFLSEHEAQLRAPFGKVIVVDVRTSIRGPRPTFVFDGHRYSTLEFKAVIGNTQPGLSYPTWWLISPQGRQVRQLPRGVEQFLDVKSHAEWLSGW
jgi:thiol-disulfide isomerase/thioredoxin